MIAAAILAAAVAAKPSVLLITVDTVRADRVGCYGYASARTPALDALAADGVRFERAQSPAPLTLPAHASILSGRVPRRHGVRDNALFRLDAKVPLVQEAFRARGYATAAFVSAAVLDRSLGLARGFAVYDDAVRGSSEGAERTADLTVAAAGAYLDTIHGPFFLWVHLYDPHFPYAPPEPFASRFRDRLYDGEIAFMDQEIARLLAKARSKAPSLIVAVAGDHGESLGEHGEDAHGIFVYQATQRVPLLLSGPGVPKGRVVAGTVGLVDLAPTLAELCGLPGPREPDGRALTATWDGRPEGAARDYEMESYFPLFSYGWAPLRALVRESTKFIDAPRPEMYDLVSDPAEKMNVRVSREDQAEALARALLDRIEGDAPAPAAMDPALAEHARRIASLGYVGGSAPEGSDEAIDPKDGIAWIPALQEGRRALKSGDPAAGIPGLERLVAKNERNLPALMTLGACYQAAGRVDDAIKIHRRALALYPKSELTWFNLGNALAAKGAKDAAATAEARAAYEKALAIAPRSSATYLALADLLARDGDRAGERAVLERARKNGLSDPAIDTRLGELALARRDRKGARAAFDRAHAADPRDAAALQGLAQLAYDGGDFRAAARWFEALLAERPTAAAARALGDIRAEKLGDPEGAKAAYRRALELTPPEDPSRAQLRKLAGDPR